MAAQVKLKYVNIHFNVLEAVLIHVTTNLKNLLFVERNMNATKLVSNPLWKKTTQGK